MGANPQSKILLSRIWCLLDLFLGVPFVELSVSCFVVLNPPSTVLVLGLLGGIPVLVNVIVTFDYLFGATMFSVVYGSLC